LSLTNLLTYKFKMCYSHPHPSTHPSTVLPTNTLSRYLPNPTYMVTPTYMVATSIGSSTVLPTNTLSKYLPNPTYMVTPTYMVATSIDPQQLTMMRNE
jgi:cytochrome c2